MKKPNGQVFDHDKLPLLQKALQQLATGFSDLPSPTDSRSDHAALEQVLMETARRLRDNYPYFHPLYAGQMLKPPHPIARLAYALALWINPNNHALDGGRASSMMEKEAVAELANLVGWKTHLGHLCSGGTMANLEALWIAGQLAPGKKIAASSQAHYTHQRLCQVLKIPFEPVPCDRLGRMDVKALEKILETGDVATVVATIGTTATGSVDPLPEIVQLQSRFQFRLHADAAYGGYFALADNLSTDTRRAFDHLAHADSLVIDPHKHGLQPYGCGCVLFRDPAVGKFYQHQSPYTYFTSEELHLGEISLECSRPGAAATALWATQKLLPLVKDGEFANRLTQSRSAGLALFDKLRSDPRWLTAFPPELDIVIWAVRAPTVTEASRRAHEVFAAAANRNLHLALANLPVQFFDLAGAGMAGDAANITCLRSVLMKPEHAQWVDQIWCILESTIDDGRSLAHRK